MVFAVRRVHRIGDIRTLKEHFELVSLDQIFLYDVILFHPSYLLRALDSEVALLFSTVYTNSNKSPGREVAIVTPGD